MLNKKEKDIKNKISKDERKRSIRKTLLITIREKIDSKTSSGNNKKMLRTEQWGENIMTRGTIIIDNSHFNK